MGGKEDDPLISKAVVGLSHQGGGAEFGKLKGILQNAQFRILPITAHIKLFLHCVFPTIVFVGII